MYAALICIDKPNHLQTRLDTRPRHVEYMRSAGNVVFAGPFLNEAGEMNGSLVVIEVEDLAQAKAWADADPYAQAGLFESVTIREWKRAIG